jgi:hypothetical protein
MTVDSGPTATPEEVFRRDNSHFAETVLELRVEAQANLSTADGRVALVRTFRYRAPANVEAVAYVRERTVTPMVVLSARTDADYEQALPDFRMLVRSYEFITASWQPGEDLPCDITMR